MYSRYGDDGKRPIRLPEHYGGSAFVQKRAETIPAYKTELSRSSSRDGGGEKISPTADRFLRVEKSVEPISEPTVATPQAEPTVEVSLQKREEDTTSSTEKAVGVAGVNFEGLRRLFSSGIGAGEDQDRLLLLGLILLLSRTGGDSDVLLWLSLLLLCG